MLQIVDLYIKIVIAVLGFLAPTVTLLLPIFSKRIPRIREAILEEEMQSEAIKTQIEEEFANVYKQINPDLIKGIKKFKDKHIKTSTSKFKKRIKELQTQLNRLDVKRQIRHIFFLLFLALFFVFLYYIPNICCFGYFNMLPFEHKCYSASVLAVSLGIFIFSLYRIYMLVSVVVDHNSENVSGEIKSE